MGLILPYFLHKLHNFAVNLGVKLHAIVKKVWLMYAYNISMVEVSIQGQMMI